MPRDSIFRILPVMLLAFTLLISPSARAQENPLPLILLHGSELALAQDGAFTPFDACIPDASIQSISSMSPDGTRFAINTFPAVFGSEPPGVGGGPLPADLWLCDGQTLTHIMAQPDDAVFFQTGQPDRFVTVGEPAWSPDGARLAWLETHVDASGMQVWLTVYEIATGAVQTNPVDLPPLFGVPGNRPTRWGETGIYTYGSGYDEATGEVSEVVHRLGPDGALLNSFTLSSPEANDVLLTIVLLPGEPEQVAVLWNQAYWWLHDPVTGEGEPLTTGLPELYNPLAPDGLSLLFESLPTNRSFYTVMTAEAYYLDAAGEVVQYQEPSSAPALHRFGISPAGAIAYAAEAGVAWWQGGEINDLPAPDGAFVRRILWGPLAWRLRPDARITFPEGTVPATPAVPTQEPVDTTCPADLPPRLIPGQQASVIDTVPNNVREAPSTEAARLGQIPSGGVFAVLEGPVCTDGYAWYRVDYGGLIGWTAEGADGAYWLAPAE